MSSETSPPKLTFRAKALENLSSSDLFRQRLHVQQLSPWFALSVLGTMVLGFLAWGILGRIPVTVDGQGIILRPREERGKPPEISFFAASGEGRISKILIQEGDAVRSGELLGEIEQPDLTFQLENKQRELDQLMNQQKSLRGLEEESTGLSQRAILIKKETTQAEIESLRERAIFIKTRKLTSLSVQQQGLRQQQQRMQALAKLQENKVSQTEPLVKEGAISQAAFIQIKEEAIRTENSVSEITSNLERVNVEIVTANEEYDSTQERIANLQAQLDELEGQFINVGLQDKTRSTERTLKIQSVKGELQLLQATLRQRSQIRSPQTGTILDMFASVGQIVQVGTPIGQIQVAGNQGPTLTALLYFTPGDGKRITPNMKVSVTPDTVKREEYGGIQGRVLSVSPYPVSELSAQEFTGDKTLAEALTDKGRKIEVFVGLETDTNTKSGYRWTASQGPNFKITSGSIVTAAVTLEENTPISYVLPILRQWTGLY